ncbi:MAG: hypothetical protein WD200_03065 [Candidatus Andersenbacteria bacterium]
MNDEPLTKPTKISQPKTKRRGRGGLFFNLLLLICIAVVAYLFVQAEQKRRTVENDLQQLTSQLDELKQSSQNSGAQVAEQVLSKIRAHMDVPTEPIPTVATIVDVDKLRETNSFYQQAKNGDHLIITERRAILYDAQRDIIIDVIPVSIGNNQATGTQAAPVETSPTPTATPEGTSPGDTAP